MSGFHGPDGIPMTDVGGSGRRENLTHMLTLRNQLASVELSNDTLQDLVDNRGKDSFIKILTEFTVNDGKVVYRGPR